MDLLTSAEAAHIYVQESRRLHNSLNTWPLETLKKKVLISRKHDRLFLVMLIEFTEKMQHTNVLLVMKNYIGSQQSTKGIHSIKKENPNGIFYKQTNLCIHNAMPICVNKKENKAMFGNHKLTYFFSLLKKPCLQSHKLAFSKTTSRHRL